MAAHGQHHITPLKIFLKVYASLIALTIFTVYTATQWNLGWLNTPLAMLIATIKVAIVALWFMHLKYDSKINKATFVSAFFFLFVFFGLTAMDVFSRKSFTDISIDNLKLKVESGATTAPAETNAEPGQGPAAK